MPGQRPKRLALTPENVTLVNAIDAFAAAILREAGEETLEPPLPVLAMKLDVLDKLARWVAVRNKLVATADPDNEGGQLDAIRKQLKAGYSPSRTLPRLGERPGDFVTHRYGRRPQDLRDDDGSDLAALKARLPRADAGGNDDDRDDAGGEDDPVSGDGGGVHADLSGDQSGDDNGADRGRDV